MAAVKNQRWRTPRKGKPVPPIADANSRVDLADYADRNPAYAPPGAPAPAPLPPGKL